MNTIHHFGDSYGANLYDFNKKNKKKHFVEIIAEHLNYQYKTDCIGGLSNEQILNVMLMCLNEIKKGDIVFVNFSFFCRGCWYDETNKLVKSTNIFYNEIHQDKIFARAGGDEKILGLLNYYLKDTEDYARRIFTLINTLFKYFIAIGVNIFYIYIDGDEFSNSLLSVGNNIKFKKGFGIWLKNNGFHKEEEGHYSEGIQSAIANAILNKTNNLGKVYNKPYEITIEDIDLNAIVKINKSLV